MPRKKTARRAEIDPSTQPQKKFKSEHSNGPAEEAIGRRSLRTRSQDENKASCNSGTHSPGKQPANKTGSGRPKRNALQVSEDKLSTQGAESVEKLSSRSKSITSCPLEVSVNVTPCDIPVGADQGAGDEFDNSRKRKVQVSPRATDKKAKLTTGKGSCQPTDTKSSASSHAKDMHSNLALQQEGLPRELPSPAQDPLFTRPVVRLTGIPTKATSGGNAFSVLTYNILAECHRISYNYSYTDPIHLNMDYRGPRIVEEIKHFDSDIVCLQEVETEYHHNTLVRTMQMLGYEGLFHKRFGDNYPEGSSTFYKSATFSLMEHHEFSYTTLANQDIDRLEHSEEVKDLLRETITRETVLLVCVLKHIQSGRDVVVGNTHIAWTKFLDSSIPCMQTAYALKMMDKLSKNGELPILLCGDFNTRETDPGYQLATDGYLNDASIKELQKLETITLPDGSKTSLVNLLWCAFQHPVRNVSSTYLTVQGEEPTVTSKNYAMDNAVDYLWSSQLQATSVTCVNQIEHYMPNIIYPSDHVSLHATYNF